VTFLVGENGSGKSTLIEVIVVAAGFNPEGGIQNFRFAIRATKSSGGDNLILTCMRKPRTGFFLRAKCAGQQLGLVLNRLCRRRCQTWGATPAGGAPRVSCYVIVESWPVSGAGRTAR
jgi:hypothetical protein